MKPVGGGHTSSPPLFSPHALLVRFEQQHEELVRQLLRRLVLPPQNLADLLLHLGLHPGIRIRLRSRGRRVVEGSASSRGRQRSSDGEGPWLSPALLTR